MCTLSVKTCFLGKDAFPLCSVHVTCVDLFVAMYNNSVTITTWAIKMYLLLFIKCCGVNSTKVVYYYYAFVCNFTCLFSYMYTYQLVVGELGTTYICLDAT